MSSGISPDAQYRSMLHSLDGGLTTEDIMILKFLCQDLLSSTKLDNITGGLDLLLALERAQLIKQGNLQLLAELLFNAQRIDLMRKIRIKPSNLELMIEENGPLLKPYRLMLHQLSEHMLQDNVKKLNNCMQYLKVPPAKLQQATDAYSLFTLLEKQDIIDQHDVSKLLELFTQMDEKDLIQIVQKYIDDHCQKEETKRDMSMQCSLTSTTPSIDAGISEYDMDPKRMGLCLIINNDVFTPVSERSKKELRGPRRGSDLDANRLKQVFSRLNFDVDIRKNLTSTELSNTLKEYASRDHSSYGAFVCCILSHGEAMKVFGTDCLPVPIHKILLRFTPNKCPSLKDKPKIFFVQACQGGRRDEEPEESLVPLMDGLSTDGGDLETDYQGRLSSVTNIPRQPDYLLGLATVPGFVSYRSKSSGSWYIQALCDILEKYHNSVDLLSMLTEVNNQVMQKEQRTKDDVKALQMPLPQHTLRKRVYFRTQAHPLR